MDLITGLLQTSILAGGVLALGALGEVMSERVGVVNLGVEGLMAMGAITGIANRGRHSQPDSRIFWPPFWLVCSWAWSMRLRR